MKKIITSGKKIFIEFSCYCGCVFKSDEYDSICINKPDGRIAREIKITDKCPECGCRIDSYKEYIYAGEF